MLNELRIEMADFLGSTIIKSDYFFVDYWTFVHLFSGVLIMSFIFRFFKDINSHEKFLLLFFLVAVWEVFERNSPLIKEEAPLDIIYDLIVGVFGGSVSYFFNNSNNVLGFINGNNSKS